MRQDTEAGGVAAGPCHRGHQPGRDDVVGHGDDRDVLGRGLRRFHAGIAEGHQHLRARLDQLGRQRRQAAAVAVGEQDLQAVGLAVFPAQSREVAPEHRLELLVGAAADAQDADQRRHLLGTHNRRRQHRPGSSKEMSSSHLCRRS